jgi:hypothetical protein
MMPGMLMLAIAAGLFAAQPQDPVTAGQMRDGCALVVARGALPPLRPEGVAAIMCEINISIRLAAGLDGAPSELIEGQNFCPPGSLRRGDELYLAMARAFIAYVDRNPASRDADPVETFDRALAEKWPCPRRAGS